MYGKRITDRMWPSSPAHHACSQSKRAREDASVMPGAYFSAGASGNYSEKRNDYRSGASCPMSGRAGAGISLEEPCAVSSLAMVYSPYQSWQDIYDPGKGLKRGTIFAQLDKPWFPDSHC